MQKGLSYKINIGGTVAALLLLLSSVGLSQKAPPNLQSITPEEIKTLEISFERTGCYGTCPAYTIAIHGDGKVEYEGVKNVKMVGRREGNINNDDVQSLLSLFDKANFFSIGENVSQEKCNCTICTDMASAITDISVAGSKHTVLHYLGCSCASKELFELEAKIDQIVKVDQWTGDVRKQGPFGTTCSSPRPTKTN